MCGIVGIFEHPEAANLAYLGLHALQHRGQESCGIASGDGAVVHHVVRMGLVGDVMTRQELSMLPGFAAIGHSRYSTTGSSTIKNAQPYAMNYAGGWLAVAHNGNLTNAMVLRRELEQSGAIFHSTMDSEVVMHLIARESLALSLADRVQRALQRVEGAYSFLFLSPSELIAVRDPSGFRPLVLGKTAGGAHVFASETCALDLIEAHIEREVQPGEMVVCAREGTTSRNLKTLPASQCIFEHIYFARPDSAVFGRNVYHTRLALGAQLAREHGIAADVICPIPDSGVPAAIGYARESGIPFQLGLIRNHYIGRTFIEPEQSIRNFGVKLKLNPVRDVLAGKRVVLIDDSIMRGTTSAKIVKMVRAAGAAEVHLRITAPPTKWPCFYGIDIPTREELIAATRNLAAVRTFTDADTLGYLSESGMLAAVESAAPTNYCLACFSGSYPQPVADAPAMMAVAGA